MSKLTLFFSLVLFVVVFAAVASYIHLQLESMRLVCSLGMLAGMLLASMEKKPI